MTLTRLLAADAAAAAGVAAPAAVRVTADVFTFELSHQTALAAPYDNRNAPYDAWCCTSNGYSRTLASQSVVLRRGQSPAPDEVAAARVEFRRAVRRGSQPQASYGHSQRAPTVDGRLGVGVAFSLTTVVD